MLSHFAFVSHEGSLEINQCRAVEVGAGPAAPASPGNLVEMHVLRFRCRPAASGVQGGPSKLCDSHAELFYSSEDTEQAVGGQKAGAPGVTAGA